MKISMIGLGKLGLPCAEVMSSVYDVIGYDISPLITCSFPSIKTTNVSPSLIPITLYPFVL